MVTELANIPNEFFMDRKVGKYLLEKQKNSIKTEGPFLMRFLYWYNGMHLYFILYISGSIMLQYNLLDIIVYTYR